MSSSLTLALKAATLLTLAGYASAFWRMPCLSRSGLARIDPLVDPGVVSGHVHAIHGSSGFSSTADTPDLLAGDCTSCQVAQDKSAYWTPALYFQNSATGEFTLVEQVGGMLVYYLLYPNAGETKVTAFPEGFSMIAGDTYQRNFSYPVPDIQKSDWNVAPYNTQAFLRQAALGFNCLNYGKAAEGSLFRHFLPDKAYLDANCANGIRLELMFPSCWDGVNKTSTDMSHVAYPSQVMTGDCPAGYDTRLVSLFYETIWNTYAFAGTDGQFVLANGDPTGYGYHGDFIMGWNETFLQSAVDQCTNPSGQIADCPLFDIQTSEEYSSCNISSANIPAQIAKENVMGAVTTLPGNPAIESGPAYAKGGEAGSASASVPSSSISSAPAASIPTLSYQAGSSIASGSEYVPGAIFAQKSDAKFAATASGVTITTTTSAAAITPAPVASTPSSVQSFFSTEYQTKGGEVLEVLWVEELTTVTTTAMSAASARKRHLHKHRRGGY